MKEQNESLKSMQAQMKKKDIRIQNLEQQIKALDRKYKDELKHKKQSIVKLEGELREKCTELAGLRMTVLTARTAAQKNTLSASMQEPYANTDTTVTGHIGASAHLIKSSSPRPMSSSRESSFSGSLDEEVDQSATLLGGRNPVPPMGTSAGKGSKLRRSRHIREPLAEAKLRPASGRKLDIRTSHCEELLPDNREILQIVAQQKKSLVDLRHGPGNVVPPIPSQNSTKKLSPRSANSAAFTKRVRSEKTGRRENSSSPDIEVETLAVGQVINRDLRKAHEFNSFGTDA